MNITQKNSDLIDVGLLLERDKSPIKSLFFIYKFTKQPSCASALFAPLQGFLVLHSQES